MNTLRRTQTVHRSPSREVFGLSLEERAEETVGGERWAQLAGRHGALDLGDDEDPRDRLAAWFADVRRDLPWRAAGDLYGIWISEIMLQQTRVETVKAYFTRWMKRLPTVAHLAAAPLDETELRAFAAERLARYKQPRAYVHLDTLPTGANGKLLRRALPAYFTPSKGSTA